MSQQNITPADEQAGADCNSIGLEFADLFDLEEIQKLQDVIAETFDFA
jgi:hypothetical protein